MVNYYRGFRRIWIILWLLSSLAILVFVCNILDPNPALPLAGIHPKGIQKPILEPYEGPSDIASSKFQKIYNENAQGRT